LLQGGGWLRAVAPRATRVRDPRGERRSGAWGHRVRRTEAPPPPPRPPAATVLPTVPPTVASTRTGTEGEKCMRERRSRPSHAACCSTAARRALGALVEEKVGALLLVQHLHGPPPGWRPRDPVRPSTSRGVAFVRERSCLVRAAQEGERREKREERREKREERRAKSEREKKEERRASERESMHTCSRM